MNYKNIIIIFVVSCVIIITLFWNNIFGEGIYYDNPNIEAIPYDLESANNLLEQFGINKRFGCTTIVHRTYSDTYKAYVAIQNVDSSKKREVSCSELYSKDDLVDIHTENERYQGKVGVCYSNSNTTIISYDDVAEVYQKMFGKDLPRLSIDTTTIHTLLQDSYDYLRDKDIFVSVQCHDCVGACYSHHIRELKSAYVKKDILRIDFYDYESGLFELNDNHYILETSKFKKSFTCTYNDECIEIIKNNYMDQLDVYEAIFQKVDDHYVFKKIMMKEEK